MLCSEPVESVHSVTLSLWSSQGGRQMLVYQAVCSAVKMDKETNLFQKEAPRHTCV